MERIARQFEKRLFLIRLLKVDKPKFFWTLFLIQWFSFLLLIGAFTVFIALKVNVMRLLYFDNLQIDGLITWPWGSVFMPLWLLDIIIMLTGSIGLGRYFHLCGEHNRGVQLDYFFWTVIGAPLAVISQVLVVLSLDGQRTGNFGAQMTPMFIFFGTMVCFSCCCRSVNTVQIIGNMGFGLYGIVALVFLVLQLDYEVPWTWHMTLMPFIYVPDMVCALVMAVIVFLRLQNSPHNFKSNIVWYLLALFAFLFLIAFQMMLVQTLEDLEYHAEYDVYVLALPAMIIFCPLWVFLIAVILMTVTSCVIDFLYAKSVDTLKGAIFLGEKKRMLRQLLKDTFARKIAALSAEFEEKYVDDFRKLLDRKDLRSDVKFVLADGREIFAHKAILEMRADIFDFFEYLRQRQRKLKKLRRKRLPLRRDTISATNLLQSSSSLRVSALNNRDRLRDQVGEEIKNENEERGDTTKAENDAQTGTVEAINPSGVEGTHIVNTDDEISDEEEGDNEENEELRRRSSSETGEQTSVNSENNEGNKRKKKKRKDKERIQTGEETLPDRSVPDITKPKKKKKDKKKKKYKLKEAHSEGEMDEVRRKEIKRANKKRRGKEKEGREKEPKKRLRKSIGDKNNNGGEGEGGMQTINLEEGISYEEFMGFLQYLYSGDENFNPSFHKLMEYCKASVSYRNEVSSRLLNRYLYEDQDALDSDDSSELSYLSSASGDSPSYSFASNISSNFTHHDLSEHFGKGFNAENGIPSTQPASPPIEEGQQQQQQHVESTFSDEGNKGKEKDEHEQDEGKGKSDGEEATRSSGGILSPMHSRYHPYKRRRKRKFQKRRDIAFELEGRRIWAHKCVLAARCEYFEAMFKFKEANEQVIPIDDVSYSAFLAFLRAIYTGKTDVALLRIDDREEAQERRFSWRIRRRRTRRKGKDGEEIEEERPKKDDEEEEGEEKQELWEFIRLCNQYRFLGPLLPCQEYLVEMIRPTNVLDFLLLSDLNYDYYLQPLRDYCLYYILIDFERISKLQQFHRLSAALRHEILSKREKEFLFVKWHPQSQKVESGNLETEIRNWGLSRGPAYSSYVYTGPMELELYL